MLECIFDAESVIIGGMMPAVLLDKIIQRLPPLYQSVRGRYLTGTRLKTGMTGSDTAALGAAALPILMSLIRSSGADEVKTRPAFYRITQCPALTS